jgi:glycosyltransferase involved in cell wall biosynthesis
MDFLLTGGLPKHFDYEAHALGARLYYVPYNRRNLASFVSSYRKLLKDGRYDALHDHSDYAAGWRLAFGTGILPHVRVVHVHNARSLISAYYDSSQTRKIARRTGKVLVESLATHICGTSSKILDDYGFCPNTTGPKVGALYCGLDVSRFNSPREGDRCRVRAEFGWSPEVKIVLFVGRLDRAMEFEHPKNQKNSWLALNIVREAANRDGSICAIVAGEGCSRTALQERVREWGLRDRVRIVGMRDDVPSLMRAADTLLFPSAQEGLGMVAVEAQAAGLRVLASEAVPSEAVVNPSIYETLPLAAPLELWADRLIRSLDLAKPSLLTCRVAVEASDFSIEKSASRLVEMYTDHP